MTEAEAQIRPDDTELVDSAPEAPPAATSPAIDNALPEDRYLNRELSWLDFNARVLALAADTSLPLLNSEVPRDLRVEPRRVLHGARRRP